jgi:DNA-binding PucR family transcriptional regulator
MERGRQVYVESPQRRDSFEVENAASLSEQKLEEAWATPEQQIAAAEYVGETSAAPEPISLEFQVFGDKALVELWKRVLWEITSRSLMHLLQTHGRLVAAGVAVGESPFGTISRECFL